MKIYNFGISDGKYCAADQDSKDLMDFMTGGSIPLADKGKQNESKDKLILKSLYAGDLESFKKLVEECGGIKYKFANGQRVIDVAITIVTENGYYDILKYLLDANEKGDCCG